MSSTPMGMAKGTGDVRGRSREALRLTALASACFMSYATFAAPPPDHGLEPLPTLSGTTLLTAPSEGAGCQGIQTNPRVVSLCDGATHALPDATIPGTTWDVVRVGYGTTATFNGYNIVAEIPTGGAGFFSPITVFSGPDGAYAVATGTFTNTTIYMAPQSLANAIATTGGVLNLGAGTVVGLNPANTYSPTMTLAALTAFGGGVVNANGTVVNLPTTLATAFQITNSGPGGGLPGQSALGQINASNMTVTLGDGIAGTGRTRGALVGGEAELNLTDSTITAGNYSLGIYNYFAGSYTGAIAGSRSNVLRSSITLGNDSVGWWGNGALAPARLTATDSQFNVGTGSWGLFMATGADGRLTNTTVSAGANSFGALMHDGTSLTIDGTSAITATGAGSVGIRNDSGAVVFGSGTPGITGGDLGLNGIAASTFELQSGSTLRVGVGQNAATAIQLDASTFIGAGGSSLAVSASGSTGTGISLTNAAVFNHAGTIAISGPGTALSANGSGTSAVLSGGGTTSGGGAGAPVIQVSDAATLDATNVVVNSAATGAAVPALLLTGADASVRFARGSLGNAQGGTVTIDGTGALVDLSDTQVGGSGQWLDVGPAAGGSAAADGTLTIARSTLTGSAQTALGSTSSVTLIDSTWFLTGSSVLTDLVNDPSVIDFAPPVGPPTLASSYKTLTVNRYAGDGTLAMNAWLAADDSPSDRLVILDGTGTGPGTIQVRNTGGGGALTAADGILLVQAVNATTATDTFALSAPVVAGPYEYFLYRGGASGVGSADNQNSWFLRSTIDCAAPGAPVPPCPAPPNPPPVPPPTPPVPPVPPTPAYRQEVSLAAALPVMSALYGRALVDTLHERVGDQHLLRQRTDLDEDRTGLNGAWVRVLAHDGERDGGNQGIYGNRGPGFDYRFQALQIGLDFYRSIDSEGNRQHAGGYLAYGKGKGDVRHNILDHDFHAGSDEFDARTIGAYWTGFNARGGYLDAVAQYTSYDLRARSTRLPDTFTNGNGTVLSLEGGWPFALGSGDTAEDLTGWRIEPQAQVIWQRVDVDDLVDDIARVRYSDGDSTVGRLGIRLNRIGSGQGRNGGARASDAWLRLNAWHEFNGSPRTEFSSATGYVPFTADLGDSWGEVGLGGTWQVSDTGYLFADVDYTWSFNGDETSWNSKVGMRWNW